MIQANTIGCQICLDELHRNPKAILKPYLVMSGKRKNKILLTSGMQNCPNLFTSSTPKKRMKKVRRSKICKFCMEVNQNCSCRLKLKNESKYVCTTCDVNYLCGTCGECLERTEYRKNRWNQINNDT